MHIVIYCPGMPFNGATLQQGQSLGGSESAAYYLSRELARLGHAVTVFTTIGPQDQGQWEGVRYLSAGAPSQQAPLGQVFEWYATHTPHDLLIIQRAPQGFHRQYAAKVNFWWSHDLALKRYLGGVAGQMWNVDRILAVSEFHRQQMAQVYGLPHTAMAVLENGVDPALYQTPTGETVQTASAKARAAWAQEKLSGRRMVYSSRPERGLEFLVAPGGVMEHLARLAPDLKLQVAGYDNTTEAMRPLYEHLWARCQALPNVELLGPLAKDKLAQVMTQAWLHLYPTRFEEVSCITAMEAQAAGNPILTCPVAALPETLAQGGVVWLDAQDEDLPLRMAQAVVDLYNEPQRWRRLHQQALAKAPVYSWADSAQKLVALAQGLLREKSAQPDRLARHLLRHSDIGALNHLLANTPEDSGIAPTIRAQVAQHYGFLQQDDLEAHNEAISQSFTAQVGHDPGLRDPEGLMATPRFQVVEEQVARLPKGARVLDYGCGQGHFTLALTQRYPHLAFHGVDIAPSAIQVGLQHAKERQLNNVRLSACQAQALEGPYDLVLALEVLEHVAQPWTLADQLEALLAPAGKLCLTVPYGPWEWETFATLSRRAHVHHLERDAVEQIWGHKPEFGLLAVPARQTAMGEALGVYRVVFGTGGAPSRPLDMAAKLAHQAPRQTVSVCMMVGPQGLTLARTLESVAPFADELVMGVDGREEDGGAAWDIARRYGAQVFAIESPLKTGFDHARNQTLARATCDWVLWIDDDEVFEWPERLWKYLRPNCFHGYAIKQHHYSVEPEGVLKTDYPCRLFRNHLGVRFFGLVHEHPETALNQGLGPVVLLPDVALAHHGYDTEDIRRRRFARNLPLMVQDRQTYPERTLGKFLWIRDLVQLNRHTYEQQGAFTPVCRQRAQEAVRLWRELISHNELRMALDALPYYSEAVALLAGEGIDFELAVGAARAGLGDKPGQPGQVVSGRFMDTADIHRISNLVMHERTRLFEEKYF